MTTHPLDPAARPPGASAWPGTAADVPGSATLPAGEMHLTAGRVAQTPAARAEREPLRAAGRTWTLEIPPGTVLRTSNDRLHRMEAHQVTKFLRILGERIARHQRIPHVERADILLTYIPPPRRQRDRHPLASARVEDAGALAPTGKALIDGLKDAGVFADDNFRHVRREIYQLLDGTDPRGRLRLHILEVPS